jgi:hypothetical protein
MRFDEARRRTLRAALDRIIPADDYPGAWDAGVGDYIARQLDGDLESLRNVYRDGLFALESEALATVEMSFVDAGAEEQDELLRRIERGDVTTSWPVEPARFFAMLVNHAAEGYYSDPGNGGNRDALSWQMVGFDTRRPAC